MTACAVACVVLGVFRLWRPAQPVGGRRVRARDAASLVLPRLRAASATRRRLGHTPGIARRCRRPAPHRVVLLGVDAASLDFISPAVADGRLPNFGRLLDAGASMHLATLRPTQPGPVWTAVATGKLPWRNGVRSAATYRAVAGSAAADLLPDFCFAHALVSFGLLTESLQTSAALRAQPVWTILGRAGLPSTIVRWPLTWPAQPLQGALISDEFHAHRRSPWRWTNLPHVSHRVRHAWRVSAAPREQLAQALEPEHEAAGTTPLALDRFYVPGRRAHRRDTGAVHRTPVQASTSAATTFCGMRAAGIRNVSEESEGHGASSSSTTRMSTPSGALPTGCSPGFAAGRSRSDSSALLAQTALERTLGDPNISGTTSVADGFCSRLAATSSRAAIPGVGGDARRRCSTTTACRLPRHGRLRPRRHLPTTFSADGRCVHSDVEGARAILSCSLIAVPRDRKEVCYDHAAHASPSCNLSSHFACRICHAVGPPHACSHGRRPHARSLTRSPTRSSSATATHQVAIVGIRERGCRWRGDSPSGCTRSRATRCPPARSTSRSTATTSCVTPWAPSRSGEHRILSTSTTASSAGRRRPLYGPRSPGAGR